MGVTRSARSDGSAVVPLDARSLRAVFLDLLDRPPTHAERERWGQADASDLVDALLATEEFWHVWLERELYYFLLVVSFRPTSERVLRLPSELARGEVGVLEALHRIALSPAFDRRNPGADTFCTVLLEQFLGLVVQRQPRVLEAAKKLYDGRPGRLFGEAGRSQADVVRLVLEQPEALRFYLARSYAALLRAEAPRDELDAAQDALTEHPTAYASLVAAWCKSPAYERRLETRRPLSNRAFVRALFVDLTDALPGAEEEQRMRAALDALADAGPLRAVLARLLLDSGRAEASVRGAREDPAAWLEALFSRLLGRAPEPAEREVFAESLADPSCRPETVVYALVSSPEYPTW